MAINWKKYKNRAIDYLLTKGGELIVKTLWNWVKQHLQPKRWLILAIVSQRKALEEIIKKNTDPKVIARNVINYICKLIDKDWIEIE